MPGKVTLIKNARAILQQLGFGERQSNDMAALVLLALADLKPGKTWAQAGAPLCGITPIIGFIAKHYDVRYAPNTRETIRDEAVKFFTEAGLLLRNPDQPDRPTNSGKTVYQIEPHALALLQAFDRPDWSHLLAVYLDASTSIRAKLERHRSLALIPVTLPDGQILTLSAGGQNPLIKAVVEAFCPRFTPGAVVA